MNHGSGVADQFAADRHDVAADIGVRAQLDVAKDRDHVFTDMTVDVSVADHSNHSLADRASHARIAHHGDHGLVNLAGTRRRAQH